ncbi:MAG: hypothetical protein IKZ87_06560, partial [Actinomycetaceae bacterium]|nr:hypothetical protein [Actinomycetaceae bacterium]
MTTPPNNNFPGNTAPNNGISGTRDVPAQQPIPTPQQVTFQQPAQPTLPASPQPAPNQPVVNQPIPNQGMANQPMPAQYATPFGIPNQPMPGQYPPASQSKKGKTVAILASIGGVIVAVLAGFLIRYALHGGFTPTPTEEEVQKGFEQIYDQEFDDDSIKDIAVLLDDDVDNLKKFFDSKRTDFAQCMTGKTYNSLSKEGKIEISKGKNSVPEEHKALIDNASDDCVEELVDQYMLTVVPT